MDWNCFSNLPDETRVWIHAFDRNLTKDEQEIIRHELTEFLPQWVSHGEPVEGAFEVVADRFVVMAGQCQGGMSGCSIDSLVRNFKSLRDIHGLDGLKGGLIFFQDEAGRVQSLPHQQFKADVATGTIKGTTVIFQTSVSTLGELRRGKFETPLRNSVLARVLPIPA